MMRFFRRFIALSVIGAAVAAAIAYWYATREITLPQTPWSFTVKTGSSFRAVARELRTSGILGNEWFFVALARATGKDKVIKAGVYEFEKNLSAWELLQELTEGDVAQSAITIIEGWTFAQLKQAIAAHPAIRKTVLHLPDSEIMRRVGTRETHPEGWFMPETYYFASDSADVSVLRRAHQLMRSRLEEAWRGRAPNLPYANYYDALIMASIVEKETGRAQERELIAAVFVNRLRRGMKLQADPAVIYGIGKEFDGNIRKRDLLNDTAYNTYMREGLPPTPIALPGMASVHAALHPAPKDYLYFVARGDGSSYFSSSLEEHNRAVAKYQLGK